MSRKVIITLAAAATVAAASLATSTAYARSFGGGGSGHGGRVTFARVSHPGTLHPILPGRPGHPFRPGHPIRIGDHHHDHWHWAFRGGRWVEINEVVDETVAATPTPGPCTCLTKSYTPTGLVVFADLCTKESASAPVDGSAADASQVPTSSDFAGRTYKDYLAANPQAPQVPQKN